MTDIFCPWSRERTLEKRQGKKYIDSDLRKALVVTLPYLCFLRLTKESHMHTLLEVGLFARIISG